MSPIFLTLILLVVAIILFATEKIPVDVVGIMLVMALVLTGVLTVQEGVAGFGNDIIITIGGLFILVGGLIKTGIVDLIGRRLHRLAGDSEFVLTALIMMAAALSASVLKNTTTTAMFLPVVIGLAAKAKIAPSKLLMPLAFGAILGGSCTLIGTSTNLAVSGAIVRYGQEPFTMFELTSVGVIVFGVGLLYMLFFGRRMLPTRGGGDSLTDDYSIREYISELVVLRNSRLVGKTLGESNINTELDLNVLGILRGDHKMVAPRANEKINANDLLIVEGKIEDILRVKEEVGLEIKPDFKLYDPWVTSELTIRDLVTHRVGLDTFSGDLLWYEANFTADEILSRGRHLKPVSSFRTRYGYQNLMFIAAGRVIEKVSGKGWCDFVTERILTPLSMARTTCSISNLPDNAAFPHNESGGKLRVLNRGNVSGADSAAALNSSVADLSKWIRLQLGKGKFEGKQIFSEAQAWQMHQPYLAQQISETSWKNNPTRHFTGVGLGWFLYDYHGRKIINHSGGLDGMLSYTVLIPEENVGFVVLTNSEFPPFAVMMNKIRDVFVNVPKRDWNAEAVAQVQRNKASAEENLKKADAARVANTKPTLALANYAATYSDDLYGAITVAEENGRLVMRFSRSPNFVADLEHWHYDTFQIKWRPSVAYNFPRGFVTFTIDREGKTDELKIDQPNNDFWFYELNPKRVR